MACRAVPRGPRGAHLLPQDGAGACEWECLAQPDPLPGVGMSAARAWDPSVCSNRVNLFLLHAITIWGTHVGRFLPGLEAVVLRDVPRE